MAKFDHLEKLWAAYLDYPTARQADKWLVGYFREHKNYGKKDRTWYSEAFFGLLRHALCFLPQEKKCDAREAWAALKSQPLKTLTPSLSQRGIESLPHTWHTWLQKSSLAQEDIPLFLEHLNTRPPLYLRANYPDRASEIEAELKSADFKVETIKQGRLVTFCIEGKTSIYELQCLKNGLIEIQDFASQLLGAAVDAHPRMTVWDICAGGGGKTLQIASQMQNRGVLYASDIRNFKLDELKLRVRRAGFHNVRRFFFDATKISDGAHSLATREVHNSGGFHRILVDAPCSASGTLRRNPDVRFRILPHDIEKFAMTQLQILTNVHPYLKVGGKLIYTTCSVFREENESVVEKFLSAHTDFKRLEQKVVGSPHLDADTMFYAVLEKK